MMLKKKFLLLCICAFATALGVGAAEHVTEIEVLKGEKWWGLDYSGEVEQPFEGSFVRVVDPSRNDDYFKPVMVSNAGRYIYSEYPVKVNFDGEKIFITSEGEKVEVQKGGKSLREAYVVCALKNFTPGVSPDPALFSQPVYETAFEIGSAQGEDEIVGYAEKLLAEGFPAGIMVVADGWQKVNGPYEFDPELYPDPKRMVDRLHALGFKAMLTVTPFTPKWGRNYGLALKNGQVLGDYFADEATLYAILDMGNDEQFERLKTGFNKIKAGCGFDGFRFDCGGISMDGKYMENMMSLGDGMNLVSYRWAKPKPYAPYLDNIVMPEYFEEGKYMCQWVIESVMTAGLMGHPYVQTDFRRFGVMDTMRTMADYLLLQCGMPVLSVDFAPWNITDPKLYEGVKAAINFRASLADYMVKLVEDSRRTGEPLVRHMEYQYPKSAFFDCNDQFMLGSKYLFAPCVDGADKRMVRFPKGTWVDRNGSKIRGPVVREVDCSAGELIYFEAAR